MPQGVAGEAEGDIPELGGSEVRINRYVEEGSLGIVAVVVV